MLAAQQAMYQALVEQDDDEKAVTQGVDDITQSDGAFNDDDIIVCGIMKEVINSDSVRVQLLLVKRLRAVLWSHACLDGVEARVDVVPLEQIRKVDTPYTFRLTLHDQMVQCHLIQTKTKS